MTEKSYQNAVQVLKDRFGNRWEGVEADGRDEMVKVLRDELGFDTRAAHDAIDAMIETGELRYLRAGDPDSTLDDAAAVPPVPIAGGGGIGSTATSGFSGTPIVPTAAVRGGYWQIGRDEGSGGYAGRAGQVEPR